MSVRRLASETVQPQKFAYSRDNLSWAKKKMAEYPAGRQQSAVIPLLWRAQEQEGWVSRPAIESVAELLDMPYIRVLEVATFYTQFQLQPVGTNAHIQVCGTTPCMLRGAEDLRAVCQSRIHHDPHHLNDAGTMSWEEVECLGACVNAPMVMIGSDTYEDLTVERFEEIVDAFAKGKGSTIKPGPQIERIYSAAEGGATTLNEVPARKATKASGPRDDNAPIDKGRGPEVNAESAPAIEGPDDKHKVTGKKAEDDRHAADEAARANGRPNRAMRPKATGAESPAAKISGGAAVSANSGPARRAKTTSAGTAPLFEAPAGDPDDLKLISGVGPVLEEKLHAFGVTKWAQIAKFSKADIAKLDAGLNFKGRIEREGWVNQARALAKGGVEEYRKTFGRDPK